MWGGGAVWSGAHTTIDNCSFAVGRFIWKYTVEKSQTNADTTIEVSVVDKSYTTKKAAEKGPWKIWSPDDTQGAKSIEAIKSTSPQKAPGGANTLCSVYCPLPKTFLRTHQIDNWVSTDGNRLLRVVFGFQFKVEKKYKFKKEKLCTHQLDNWVSTEGNRLLRVVFGFQFKV